MEVIQLSSYTRQEKLEIAKRHLVPKQLEATGLKGRVRISAAALYSLIDGYTQEAGVRNLERNITKLLRKCAKRIAAGEADTLSIGAAQVETYMGPRRVKPAFLSRSNAVGVANGLAWTSIGGEILPIEVQVVPGGNGRLELTGSLGDVMKESAKLALTYAKVNAEQYGYSLDRLKNVDIHIHAPEGAVPKDGPSAGITLATALISCLSERPVRSDVAMTGEITLHGNVLPIGGLKEKSMAAYREGMHMVLIPQANTPDLYEVDDVVKQSLVFRPVSTLEEVLGLVLLEKPGQGRSPKKAHREQREVRGTKVKSPLSVPGVTGDAALQIPQ
jgi:ATP-dependent Lon protease